MIFKERRFRLLVEVVLNGEGLAVPHYVDIGTDQETTAVTTDAAARSATVRSVS